MSPPNPAHPAAVATADSGARPTRNPNDLTGNCHNRHSHWCRSPKPRPVCACWQQPCASAFVGASAAPAGHRRSVPELGLSPGGHRRSLSGSTVASEGIVGGSSRSRLTRQGHHGWVRGRRDARHPLAHTARHTAVRKRSNAVADNTPTVLRTTDSFAVTKRCGNTKLLWGNGPPTAKSPAVSGNASG